MIRKSENTEEVKARTGNKTLWMGSKQFCLQREMGNLCAFCRCGKLRINPSLVFPTTDVARPS